MRSSSRFISRSRAFALGPFLVAALAVLSGCGRQPIVAADGLPLRRVVVYRNGVAYFERSGHVEESEVRFRMKETEVGDFLATLAVSERGGSSVRSAAFPLRDEEEEREKEKERERERERELARERDFARDRDRSRGPEWDRPTPPRDKPPEEKKGMKQVVLSLDGKAHDLEVGYVAESPVWRPSYRLVVESGGEAYLQAWGIVQNLSGEDWRDVKLSLVAGAPLAFEAQLGQPIVPERPVVTDHGEVIAAVPRGDTSLRQEAEPATKEGKKDVTAELDRPDRDGDGILDSEDADDAPADKTRSARERKKGELAKRPAPKAAAGPMGAAASLAEARGAGRAPASTPAAPPPPPPPPPRTQAPRNLRSFAAVAVEAGATRYDLPQPVTIPDKSATMVMLLSRRVPGEALFLFAPDGGVPDSSSHPFRVVRFSNKTAGVLERGPIAVFEQGSFLGQGMLDPLPAAATATVPFALDRALAVDQEHKSDELGERIAKIENAELTIERDSVRVVKYRLRNGGETEAKLLVRHPRIAGARLHQPPPETEDNVGTQTALVPARIKAHATAELVVDERTTFKRREDWFSVIADNAVKAYLADARADKAVAAKLGAAWQLRKEIVDRHEARAKLAQEQATLAQQTQETRANLRAIEKNKAADQLRVTLTKRLADTSTRVDEVSKRIVEIDAKLAELRIQFKELLRDVVVTQPLPVK